MAKPDKIMVGTAPSVTAVFTNSSGVATNPTTVRFTVVAPDRTKTVYTAPHASIINPSTGTWIFTLPAGTTLAGSYYVYVEGVGNGVTVADEVEILSYASHVPAA